MKLNKLKIGNSAKAFFKIAITSILLYYILSKTNYLKIKELFEKCDLRYFFLALLSYFISVFILSSRLLSFFNSIGIKLKRTYNIKLYFLGLFYNFCLPGGIGGDGYKIYILHKQYQYPVKKIALVILFDRISGLWAIGFMLMLFSNWVPQISVFSGLIFILFSVCTVIYFFLIKLFLKEFTKHFLAIHIKGIIAQGLQLFSVIFILLALNYKGNYFPYVFTFLISSLVAVIPFTIGGLGAREFVFNHFSDYFHMNTTLAIFVSLSFYVITVVNSLMGVYYAFNLEKIENEPSDIKSNLLLE